MITLEEIGEVAVFSSLGPVKRVAAAVGEGSMSIAFVHQYLRELEPAGDGAPAPN